MSIEDIPTDAYIVMDTPELPGHVLWRVTRWSTKSGSSCRMCVLQAKPSKFCPRDSSDRLKCNIPIYDEPEFFTPGYITDHTYVWMPLTEESWEKVALDRLSRQ